MARRTGVAVALAFERSGQAVLGFEHDDWRDRLAADPPDFVKVLIRHRADGDAGDVATQLDRLVDVSDAVRGEPGTVPARVAHPVLRRRARGSDAEQLEVTVRPRLVVEAITQIQDAGVEPGVWKVEGVADPVGCAAIAAARAPRRP